jgi:hypothetical protein
MKYNHILQDTILYQDPIFQIILSSQMNYRVPRMQRNGEHFLQKLPGRNVHTEH